MNKLGEMVARIWWGGDPDEKHPVSGMSLRDVYYVKKSWARVYADAAGNGLNIFLRIFRADPESRSFFPDVAQLSETQTGASASFRAHVLHIMASLDCAVQHLAEPDVVVPMMHRLGHSHKRKNIRQKHFWIFRDVLVAILQRSLHSGEATLAAWARFVHFMYTHIFSIVTD